jgi:lipopolysaccharide export LptBFGC system permease protein LptF
VEPDRIPSPPALPTACIVLALVGIPLGLSSKKGGKSSGFVLTILLVFLYYSISLIGVSFARQGHLSPLPGSGSPTSCFWSEEFFCSGNRNAARSN